MALYNNELSVYPGGAYYARGGYIYNVKSKKVQVIRELRYFSGEKLVDVITQITELGKDLEDVIYDLRAGSEYGDEYASITATGYRDPTEKEQKEIDKQLRIEEENTQKGKEAQEKREQEEFKRLQKKYGQ